jgi:endogenous inhibitor of DNA gyrase (YacG/DUF329 family)
MRCPTCQTDFLPTASTTMPFCSQRCREIDLGRWLDEDNAVLNVPGPEDDEIPDDDWGSERCEGAEEEVG